MIHQLPHHHGTLTERLRIQMPQEAGFDAASDIFKAMSDGKRLQIFWLLCHCEECVFNIATLLSMNASTVSHHLKQLKAEGFVASRRVGKEVIYTVVKTPKTEILHELAEALIETACPTREVFEECREYDSQLSVVNAVHDELVSDITKHSTIDELAQRFHINTTTLKMEFKRVFGMPIAAYMKDYRIRRAKELLTGTDMPIAEIAHEVGYENQSKFTQAFKSVTGALPKEYRKLT